MTYSRPNTRTVNAFADPGRPEQIEVRGQSRPVVSRAGEYLDNRNPNQLIRNQEASQVAVNNFIETLTNQGSKLYEGYLREQAPRQVAEVQKRFTNEELFTAAKTDEVRDAIRPLNVFAQDMLDGLQAQYSGTKYSEVVQALTEKSRPLLQSPDVSAEEKAAEWQKIRAEASSVSGLDTASPAALAIAGKEIARTDASVKGSLYAGEVQEKRKRDETKFANGFRESNTIVFDSVLGNTEIQIDKLRASIQDKINKSKKLFFGPPGTAAAIDKAITEDYYRLISQENYDAAADLMDAWQKLAAAGGIKFSNGMNLFDVEPKGTGKSLGLRISELQQNAIAFQEKANKNLTRAKVGDLLLELQNGLSDPAEINAKLNALLAGLDNTEIGSAIQQFSAGAGALGRGTMQQNIALQRMLLSIPKFLGRTDVDPDVMLQSWDDNVSQALSFGAISASGAAEALAQARSYLDRNNPEKDIYDSIQGAQRATEDAVNVAVGQLLIFGTTDPDGPEGTQKPAFDGLTDEQASDYLRNDLNRRVDAALLEKAKAANNEGKPWTISDYEENRRAELNIQAQKIRDELKEGTLRSAEGMPETRGEIIQRDINALNSVISNGAPITVNSFPLSLRQRFKRNQPGKAETVKGLAGELVNQLKALKKKDGSPVFPDPVNFVKDMLKNSPNANEAIDSPAGFTRRSRYSRGAIQELEGAVKTKGKDQANASPLEGLKQMMTPALQQIAQVVTGSPAKAGTLTEELPLDNEENIRELAKVMARQEPLSLKTTALPQVASASTVRRVPIAITNDKHSYFVAIGIAEGTRTPSGGYTKAYYGHRDPSGDNWNRGTVSGGRGATRGMSPQQVDRVWMGTLTRTASAMAPRLQALGLMPNTQGWNRLMFNILDLRVQAPAALRDATGFLNKIPKLIQQGLTVEAIAKARADSFYSPTTGRLDASGFGNNYSRLFADQRSRAGVFDYRSRL